MCYAKPAPRCSNHAKQALARAEKNFARERNHANAGKLKDAREDYYTSLDGIQELKDKAEAATNPEEAEEYRQYAEHYTKRREEQMAHYNRVKHLPAERRTWDYDVASGYADGWNVEEDTDNEPLINVHTGYGEDYLAANKLTELYGWTTDDADGSEEEPIYIDRTYEGEVLETIAVRSVELDNVVTGESRTIYRLDQGDGSFNTFGSREEVEAEVANQYSGTVISKEEYDALSAEQEEEQYEAYFGDEYDEDGYNKYGYDDEGRDRDGFTEGDRGYDPVDREGFNKEGLVGFQHAVRNQDTGRDYERVTKSGHTASGFKIATYDQESAWKQEQAEGISFPATHLSYYESEYGWGSYDAADNPEILEDMDKKDASLPFHHEETGTLFNREGKDYWGRTRDEAKAALQESLASGEW